MSDLLGRTPQYTCIDEFDPPNFEWFFESDQKKIKKIVDNWDVFFEKHSIELFIVLLFFNNPAFRVKFEADLKEMFWYRIDVQTSIKYNALLLSKSKKMPQRNYYREHVNNLLMIDLSKGVIT